MKATPWEIEPRFTEDNLCTLGYLIRDVREGVVSLYDPAEGDGPWSLGCRAYERTINRLQRLAQQAPWLRIIREHNLYCLILVNGLPIRFYRGRFDTPPGRTLRQNYPELRAHQLSFFETEWVWRIAIETDDDGSVLNITIAQYDNNGNFRNPWQIPILEPIHSISSLSSVRHESVELPKPIVLPLPTTIQEGIEDASGQ